MSMDRFDRVEELFLASIEMNEEERQQFLHEECGDDESLLVEVQSLLREDARDNDPLEAGLAEVSVSHGSDADYLQRLLEEHRHESLPISVLTPDEFLRLLSQIEILTDDEVSSWSQSQSEQVKSNARSLAGELVKDGKLTHYQASILLKGQADPLLIDKYLILDAVDSGGMGIVFKAVHRPMNRVVALKMLPEKLLNSGDKVNRFRREVRVAASLVHPNIVMAHDADESKGVHFLVMEFVSGQDLRKLVRDQGPLPVPEAVDILRQAAEALKYAHRKNVIHRDIKPRNIMLSREGDVKVLDMGLARIEAGGFLSDDSEDTGIMDSLTYGDPMTENPDLTQAGAVMGTVSFMAPEQAVDAKNSDARTDIYSLGCTFCFLLTGEPPYKADGSLKTILAHRENEIPSLREQRPDVPEDLENVFQMMMQKKPQDRFQSAEELLDAIEDCAISLPPEMKQRQRPKRTQPLPGTIAEQTVQLGYHRDDDDSAQRRPRESRRYWETMAALAILIVAGGLYIRSRLFSDGSGSRRRSEVHSRRISDLESDPAEAVAGLQLDQKPLGKSALRFGGGGSYVQLPKLGYSGGPATIEMWLTRDGRRTSAANSCMMTLDGKLYLGTKDYFEFGMNQRPSDYAITKSDIQDWANQRVHVAGVFDGTTLQLYIDGKKQSGELYRIYSQGGEFVRDRITPQDIQVSAYHRSNDSWIGSDPSRRRDEHFSGVIDELRISKVARYSAEFTPADQFPADEHTLALYHFDDGQGDVLLDSSGNGFHGKIHGATWLPFESSEPSPPPTDYALQFDGKDDYVEFGTAGWTGGALTVEAWCRPERLVRPHTIAHLTIPSRQNANLDFRIRRPGFKVATVDHTDVLSGRDPEQLLENELVHIAGVWNGREATLFLNGVSVPVDRSTARLTIGQDPAGTIGCWTSKKGGYFWGEIHQVRISNSVRYHKDFVPEERFSNDGNALALYHFDKGRGEVLVDSSGNGHHGRIHGATWVQVEEESKTQPPQLIDLLTKLEIDRDIVSGQWRRESDVLKCSNSDFARVQIPYEVPREYDVTVIATPREELNGNASLSIGLVSAAQPFQFSLGYRGLSALEQVNGGNILEGTKNPTITSSTQLKPNEPIFIHCRIRDDGVEIAVDGSTVIDWKGSPMQLSRNRFWKMPNDQYLFIGVNQCAVDFSQLSLLIPAAPPFQADSDPDDDLPIVADERIDKLAIHTRPVNELELTPDGRYLVSVADGWEQGQVTVSVYDTQQRRQVGEIFDVSASACECLDNRTVLLSFYKNQRSPVKEVPFQFEVRRLPDLSLVSQFGESVNEQREIKASPDGRYLCTVQHRENGRFQVWDLKGREVIQEFAVGENVARRSLSISPEGNRAVFTKAGGTLQFVDLDQLEESTTLDTGLQAVLLVRWVPHDPDLLIVGGLDGSLQLWNLQEPRSMKQFAGHTDGVYSAKTVGAGKYLLSGSADDTLRIWEVETGRELYRFEGDRKASQYSAVSESTRLLYSAGGKWIGDDLGWKIYANSRLSVWRLPDDEELNRLLKQVKSSGTDNTPYLPDDPAVLALLGKSEEWEWSEPEELPLEVVEHASTWKPGSRTFVTSLNLPDGVGGNDCWLADLMLDDAPKIQLRAIGSPPNGQAPENNPCLSRDGNHLLFWSSRDGRPKIWESARDSTDASFSEPLPLAGPVNEIGNVQASSLSEDSLELIFTSTRLTDDSQGRYDLWYATRENRNSDFGTPENIGRQINSNGSETHPRLIVDDLGLLFHRDESPRGPRDLHLAWRTSKTHRFQASWPLCGPLNSDGNEEQGWLLDDGKIFVLVRRTPEKQFFVSRLVRRQ